MTSLNRKQLTDLPLVSVLMTSYNREQFIAEAIESILACGYEKFELIIVDDASTDKTLKIAKAYAGKDPRVNVYVNTENLGDYPNRNRAASLARGEYLVYTDSDDWMFQQVMELWLKTMIKADAGFGIFVMDNFREPVVLEPKGIIRKHFFEKPVLLYGPVATIIKRTYFQQINGFPEKYGPANDMYYNLKAAANTTTVLFPFPLNNYRRHEGQEINNKYSYLYNNYLYLNDALKELDLGLTENEKEYLMYTNKRRFIINCCHYLFSSGEWNKTVAAFKKAKFRTGDFLQALHIKRVRH